MRGKIINFRLILKGRENFVYINAPFSKVFEQLKNLKITKCQFFNFSGKWNPIFPEITKFSMLCGAFSLQKRVIIHGN